MTIGELEARISIRELNEWRIREQVEPFGERRDDLRFGLLAAFVASRFDGLYTIHTGKRHRRKWMPWDVFPLIEKPVKTPEQVARQLQMMFHDPELDDEHGRET